MGRRSKGLPTPIEATPLNSYKDEERQEFLAWLAIPREHRKPRTRVAIAKKLKVSLPTTYNWEQSKGNGHIDIGDLSDEEKIKIYDRLLFELMQDPKRPSKDRELFARRYGLLIDKSVNIDVKVDADEIARRNFEADRELREWRGKGGHRVEEVQERPSLLSD